ncbi:DUF397 domain-containing protein [Nocardiopsis synnemataformans]|uniref:DUF397 domain-containing protein n=1 Tax=Nocardiopsis synnemataformans TaxID=61305 RepID=UPI003EBBA2B8
MDTKSLRWFKSSHSSFEGACLEVALTEPVWHKSSYSSFENGNCVEVAFTDRLVVLVRDTQNRDGTVLDIGAREWLGFMRLPTAR